MYLIEFFLLNIENVECMNFYRFEHIVLIESLLCKVIAVTNQCAIFDSNQKCLLRRAEKEHRKSGGMFTIERLNSW